MKKGILSVLLVIVCCSFNPIFSFAQKPIELTLNTWAANVKHPLYVNILKPYADEVLQKTQGQLKITVHVNAALASDKIAYNAVQEGVCDITGVMPGNDPKRFPLIRLLSLPMLYSSGEQASRAFFELRQKYPQFDKEFGAVKILWINTNDVSHILSVKEPIRKVEDIKGKICANWGHVTPVLLKLGAKPVFTNSQEVYPGCQNKVYDAVVENVGWFRALRMEEVIKSITLVGFEALQMIHVMNLDKYNSLPPDAKKVLEEVSAVQTWKTPAMFDNYAQELFTWLRDKHKSITFYSLSPEEREKFSQAVSPLREEWVADAKALGYPAEAMLKDFAALCKKYEKK
jgi:TRAP-type transport system periplasmic protein